MGMGTRESQERQEEIWIANGKLARSPSHPFYRRLNELLESEKFDEFVEGLCGKFYAEKMGRRSLVPGVYFRSLLIGYFEGIDSERGVAWRLIDVETHGAVFAWVLGLPANRGMIQSKRVGIDVTTLEA